MTQTGARSGTEVVAQSQPLRTTSIFAIVIVTLVALVGVHITQGTAAIGFGDLVKLVWGAGDDTTWNILVGSRLPRMVSGVLVGLALGCAGCALQSLARNTLASPDTLGVNAGAYLAVSIVAAFGISLPVLSGRLVAFAGGLAAVALVLALATGSSGPTRLILAGSAIALASSSLANLLLILFQENTRGLYKWGNGSLLQVDIDASLQMAPVIIVMCTILVIAGRRLDLLGLGDDAAASLGLNVKTTRIWVVLAAVMLAAAAVSIVGPIGFVGLAAPVIVRLYAVRHRHLHRHHLLIPLSGLAGAILVIGADIGLRVLLGPEAGVEIPTGVITAILGSIVLVTLARQLPNSGNMSQPPGAHFGSARTSSRTTVAMATLSVLLVGALAGAILLGDTWILFGDVVNWAKGQAGYTVSAVMAERTPRVLAAALAGMALGLAGVATQAVARNPLAEPSLLGITAGAGLGAIIVISYSATIGIWALQAAAFTGALIAFVLVYSLAWRGGINSDRLILVGIGISVGLESLISLVIITTDPWNLTKSITWLAGSTYGRSYA